VLCILLRPSTPASSIGLEKAKDECIYIVVQMIIGQTEIQDCFSENLVTFETFGVTSSVSLVNNILRSEVSTSGSE